MIFHAPWHRKLWRYHLQTGTTSLRRRENTEAILERRIRDEWYAKYIDYMIEEGYLEPGDEKISKSYAMGALTYGEAAYAAERVSKGLSSALNVSKNKYKKAMPKEEWWLFRRVILKKGRFGKRGQKQKLVLCGTPKM